MSVHVRPVANFKKRTYKLFKNWKKLQREFYLWTFEYLINDLYFRINTNYKKPPNTKVVIYKINLNLQKSISPVNLETQTSTSGNQRLIYTSQRKGKVFYSSGRDRGQISRVPWPNPDAKSASDFVSPRNKVSAQTSNPIDPRVGSRKNIVHVGARYPKGPYRSSDRSGLNRGRPRSLIHYSASGSETRATMQRVVRDAVSLWECVIIRRNGGCIQRGRSIPAAMGIGWQPSSGRINIAGQQNVERAGTLRVLLARAYYICRELLLHCLLIIYN